MRADVVDAEGEVVSDDRVMLHHVVFAKLGVPDSTCRGLGLPLGIERFYGSGEERNTLSLPSGYGYANRASDRWGIVYMLMNHRAKPDTVWIRYQLDYETEQELVPGKPLWLDVRNCRLDPIFDVPGTGGPGSLFARSSEFMLSESGYLIAGTGHLHGGGVRLELTDATCGRLLLPRSRAGPRLAATSMRSAPSCTSPGPPT